MIILNSLPRWFLAATGSLLLLCAGCDPKDWVCWAPDGQHAFVRGSDDTWLVDGSGKILGKATDARAWLPDSRHVIAVRAVKPRNWDEYAQLLGPERAEKTTAAAARLPGIIRSYHGDWSKFGESEPYKTWENAETGKTYNGEWLILSVFFYLQQTHKRTKKYPIDYEIISRPLERLDYCNVHLFAHPVMQLNRLPGSRSQVQIQL